MARQVTCATTLSVKAPWKTTFIVEPIRVAKGPWQESLEKDMRRHQKYALGAGGRKGQTVDTAILAVAKDRRTDEWWVFTITPLAPETRSGSDLSFAPESNLVRVCRAHAAATPAWVAAAAYENVAAIRDGLKADFNREPDPIRDAAKVLSVAGCIETVGKVLVVSGVYGVTHSPAITAGAAFVAASTSVVETFVKGIPLLARSILHRESTYDPKDVKLFGVRGNAIVDLRAPHSERALAPVRDIRTVALPGPDPRRGMSRGRVSSRAHERD